MFECLGVIEREMGLGGENGKVESWEVGKSKVVKKKKKKEVVEAKGGVEEEEIGCWVRLRFLGSCISSRSKVDSSISGTTTHYGNFCLSFWENFVFLLGYDVLPCFLVIICFWFHSSSYV